MRGLLSVLLVTAAFAGEDAPTPAPRQTALTARLVLKVVHPAEVRKEILGLATPLGGFPILVEDQQLVLKLPPEKLTELLEAVAKKGVALEKTLERKDLTESISQLQARIRSKVEIFRRLRKLVDDSNVAATLQIERQMNALVQEMEALRGKLRVELARAQHAQVTVAFQFRERQRLVYVRSPFEWINSVDLGRLDADF